MSVFGMGVTATDKLFLEFVLPGLNIEVIENTVLYGRFETDTEHCVGKYAVFKALVASAKSARPSSSSTFPTAKQGTYDEYTLFMKRGMYAQLQFDGLAMACSRGKGAVMDLLQSETKGIMIHIANKLNRQFWGDGSGRLARVDVAASGSPTVGIDQGTIELFGQDSNEYTFASEYIDPGMDCDIITAGGSVEAEEVEISSLVDTAADGTSTLTMGEAVDATVGSFIFDHDTYSSSRAAGAGVPMGLMGIINTANPYEGITAVNFQGVNRDTAGNEWAEAYMEDMGDVAVTNAKMMKVCHKVEKYGRVKVIICNGIIWRSYYQILEADKTLPNEKAMWGGVTGLTFYGGRAGAIPVIWDDDCPDQRMFFLDTDYLQVYAPTDDGLTWLPGDAGVLTRVQGADESTASLVWYYNFGCDRPQAQGVLYDIKHAAT